MNGLTPEEGRVEVRINGTWGTLCDNGFDINDAHVICRSLGLTGALGTTPLSEFGPSSLNIHAIDLQCNGNETDISECPRRELKIQTMGCNSFFNEAGVRCSDCRDINPSCEEWARQGACESYPSEVLPVCQTSCHQCTLLNINDSASALTEEETCVAGHCFLDSNNAQNCIPAVDVCGVTGWYQGVLCVPTPIAGVPSSMRCMDLTTERTRTTLSPLKSVEKLRWRMKGLSRSTVEANLKIEEALMKLIGYFAYIQRYNLELHPEQILARQRQDTVLFLYNTSLVSIEANTFTGFPNLLTLILGSNKIQKIRNTAFTGLHKLQHMNIQWSELSSIEKGTFTHLNSLLYLELFGNHLEYLQPGVFTGLSNLRELGLHLNRIQGIDKGVFDGLKELEFLYLYENQISHLDVGAFSDLENLKIL
ncbi:leucine-rich repeat-containing protein 4-like [Lytechinus variegatus]|uniref:leucine-rich repeat-containing protein 4-like n=2 Tax=Lytechinus variegatus TaxID=7654 RepID=UPI001BB1C496|nr:leucine-rich repeat-containing protein 4-like [Lytechinus variegatus]